MSSRVAVVEQIEDLGLDGHVERGRRLVGDQQLGSQASAIAIITRCRMPPETGADSRRAALRRGIRPRRAARRARDLRGPVAVVPRSVSVIYVPTVSVGLRSSSGPGRSSRAHAADVLELPLGRGVRSRPPRATRRRRCRRQLGTRPMIESAVTDLPQPDSPTSASSPLLDVNDTPSTARTTPSRSEEVRLQVADAEDGPRHHVSLVRGSSASRRPSPMKLSSDHQLEITAAGNTIKTGSAGRTRGARCATQPRLVVAGGRSRDPGTTGRLAEDRARHLEDDPQ